MNDRTDQQLLTDYANHHSEAAFTELVRRHIDLVHSAAFRMTGEAHSAEDVTQAVFVALAQSAARLSSHPVLSGWLHTTARHLAAKNIRAAVRRQNHEQEAVAMNELRSNAPDTSWQEIAPHLDAALGELNELDRDAVLLRYFEKKSAQEIAAVLGVTAEAAQKRVSRTVERLREYFAKRGVTVGASGLAVTISAHAVQAAPVGLALTISTAATLTGTTLTTTATVTATNAIAMTALQKTIIAATIAVLGGAGIYEAHQASQLRGEVQTFQQRQASLAEQITQLNQSLIDASNKVVGLGNESEGLNKNSGELLKLRGEIAQLRLNQPKPAPNENSIESEAAALAGRVIQIRTWLEQFPNQNIPELQVLLNRDWLLAAAPIQDWEGTERQLNFAASILRTRAKELVVQDIGDALANYVSASQGQLPSTLSELRHYLRPEVTDDMLARYELLHKGDLSSLSIKEPIISEKTPAQDGQYDAIFSIGAFGYSYRKLNVLGSGGSGEFLGTAKLQAFMK